jgi:hypothetical protein
MRVRLVGPENAQPVISRTASMTVSESGLLVTHQPGAPAQRSRSRNSFDIRGHCGAGTLTRTERPANGGMAYAQQAKASMLLWVTTQI